MNEEGEDRKNLVSRLKRLGEPPPIPLTVLDEKRLNQQLWLPILLQLLQLESKEHLLALVNNNVQVLAPTPKSATKKSAFESPLNCIALSNKRVFFVEHQSLSLCVRLSRVFRIGYHPFGSDSSASAPPHRRRSSATNSTSSPSPPSSPASLPSPIPTRPSSASSTASTSSASSFDAPPNPSSFDSILNHDESEEVASFHDVALHGQHEDPGPLFPLYLESVDGSVCRMYTRSEETRHYMVAALSHYSTQACLLQAISYIDRNAISQEVVHQQKQQLDTWSFLSQTVFSALFDPARLAFYRDAICSDLVRLRSQLSDLVHTIKLKNLQLPVSVEEAPRLEMRVTRMELPDYIFEFDAFMHAPSFAISLEIKGTKMRMPFALALDISGLTLRGRLLVRVPPGQLREVAVSFVEMPEQLELGIHSSVKVGSIQIPFQKKIETVIHEKVCEAAHNYLINNMLLPRWNFVFYPVGVAPPDPDPYPTVDPEYAFVPPPAPPPALVLHALTSSLATSALHRHASISLLDPAVRAMAATSDMSSSPAHHRASDPFVSIPASNYHSLNLPTSPLSPSLNPNPPNTTILNLTNNTSSSSWSAASPTAAIPIHSPLPPRARSLSITASVSPSSASVPSPSPFSGSLTPHLATPLSASTSASLLGMTNSSSSSLLSVAPDPLILNSPNPAGVSNKKTWRLMAEEVEVLQKLLERWASVSQYPFTFVQERDDLDMVSEAIQVLRCTERELRQKLAEISQQRALLESSYRIDNV